MSDHVLLLTRIDTEPRVGLAEKRTGRFPGLTLGRGGLRGMVSSIQN